MWLLAGLGNPGAKYAGNRHNIGFMVIDRIAADYGFPAFRSKFQGLMSEGTIAGQKVALLKPQTYMNNSGQSVQAAARFYKIASKHIVVFHDEVDLSPGKVRVKTGGGNAGHNGLHSIDAHMGTADYGRVRLGVGKPATGDVSGHVLSDFSKADEAWLEPLTGRASEHVALIFRGDQAGYASALAG